MRNVPGAAQAVAGVDKRDVAVEHLARERAASCGTADRASVSELEYQEKAPRAAGLFELRLRGDYFGVSPFASTSTRRFGCRHSISSFMFFWSHCTTGCFSPMPIVSIFALSTPLLTR